MNTKDVPWMLGAYEVGVLFSASLYGFVLSQVFRYTQEKFKDPIWLKLLVLSACTLDTTHTVASWSLLYHWSVDNFGSSHKILEIRWSFILAFAVSPFMGAVVQSFYAYRMLLLLSRPYLPLIVWLGAATRVGFGIYRIVPFAQSKTIPMLVKRFGWLLETALAINVGLDIVNTLGLLYCLSRTRPQLLRSRKLVDTLSRYTIETGLTTSIFAVVTLVIVHYTAHENFIFLGLLSIYPKLYTNSLFVSLNSRVKLRQIYSNMNNEDVGDQIKGKNLIDIVKKRRSPRTSTTTRSSNPTDPDQPTPAPTTQLA